MSETFVDALRSEMDSLVYDAYVAHTRTFFGQNVPVLSPDAFHARRRVLREVDAHYEHRWGRSRGRRLVARLFRRQITSARFARYQVIYRAFDAGLPKMDRPPFRGINELVNEGLAQSRPEVEG